MHVAVLGAGVVGITTAYYLAQRGHTVTVIDQAGEVASGTSHANGGQLSYSFTDALARPEFVARIPALLLGADPAIQVRKTIGAGLCRWGFDFLRQCTSRRANANTVAVLKLAMRSARLMDSLRSDVPLRFSFAPAGKLLLLSKSAQLDTARQLSELKKENGCETQVLSMAQAGDIEPALAAMRSQYVGAVYAKDDHVADANEFSKGMHRWLENDRGVSFRFGDPIRNLAIKNQRLQAIELSSGSIEVDAAVACLGVWGAAFLRPLGVDPHVYPVRGYSVTLPLGTNAPSVSVTDLGRRLLFSRLNGQMRLAGFADFLGFDSRRDPARIRQMIEIAQDIAPDAADYDAANRREWGGFRPMTPDGRPRVGSTAVEGLFLNTGHGTLGWTLACATGHDVAGQVDRFLS